MTAVRREGQLASTIFPEYVYCHRSAASIHQQLGSFNMFGHESLPQYPFAMPIALPFDGSYYVQYNARSIWLT